VLLHQFAETEIMTQQQYKSVAPATLKSWLHDKKEIALVDVREHGQYGEEHLFYVVSAPYSKLELDIQRLVPRKTVRLVLVGDDTNELTARAAHRLEHLGYSDIYLLDGGIAQWENAGYQVFAGVNLPSKVFGELVEHAFHTPRITAQALNAKIATHEDIVILDGRPFTEYRKMSIPTAACCPNGELALRIDDLVANPDTTIVINCAGRTRSIIGAQTLINLGVKNKVLALENGTQGWYLADLQLDHGASQKYTETINVKNLTAQQQRAKALAEKHDVAFVDVATVVRWLTDTTRTTFLCDVRSPEEFARGSIPGSQHTPGGQLVQATDQYVGVRGARLVVFDEENVRAPAMASWLAMMGWEVAVLTNALTYQWKPQPTALPVEPPTYAANVSTITAEQLKSLDTLTAFCVDIRASTKYRKAHLKGFVWSIRPQLNKLPVIQGASVVVVAEDLAIAHLAALELLEAGATHVQINIDTPQQWKAASLEIIATPSLPSDQESIDYLFFVHDRHDGNRAAAMRYLEWEINLLNQIDEQERQSYRLTQ
jgi:rhodanese-related sulfurtransferase